MQRILPAIERKNIFKHPFLSERFTPNAHVWAGFFQPCKRKNFASTTFWRKVYTKRSILARVLAAVQRKNCTSTHFLAKGLHKTLTLGPGSCSRLAQEFYKHPFSGERFTQNAHFWAGFLGACTILKIKNYLIFILIRTSTQEPGPKMSVWRTPFAKKWVLVEVLR